MTGQVDRGPEGLQVLTFVRNLTWSFPRNVLALIGPLAVWDDVVSVASGFGLLPRKILKEITAIDWGRFCFVLAASCMQDATLKLSSIPGNHDLYFLADSVLPNGAANLMGVPVRDFTFSFIHPDTW